jgi:hypothetical protein
MVLAVPAREEAAVDLGVQRLDPTVENLRCARHLGNVGHNQRRLT